MFAIIIDNDGSHLQLADQLPGGKKVISDLDKAGLVEFLVETSCRRQQAGCAPNKPKKKHTPAERAFKKAQYEKGTVDALLPLALAGRIYWKTRIEVEVAKYGGLVMFTPPQLSMLNTIELVRKRHLVCNTAFEPW